jgi:hypothetical protein
VSGAPAQEQRGFPSRPMTTSLPMASSYTSLLKVALMSFL